jgi:hypothetical protein
MMHFDLSQNMNELEMINLECGPLEIHTIAIVAILVDHSKITNFSLLQKSSVGKHSARKPSSGDN